MKIKEQVANILKEVKQGRDLSNVNDIVEGGYLDSMELMVLITCLSDAFKVEIDFDDISPENFNSIDSISKMIERKNEVK